MKKHHTWSLGALLAATLLLASCQKEISTSSTSPEQASKSQKAPVPEATVSVYATGLNNPRGLEFGPDGALYVAEGGTGGANSTVGLCTQVDAPVGPYTGSPTGGRISRISSNGTRTTVTDQLPSSQTSAALGNLVSGVADVAFIGNTLYALLAGGGCSHGVPAVPNGIVRINSNGSWTLVANLSAWQLANPIDEPAPDFEPEGTWYSMVAVRGDLYAIEPNQGQLVKVTTDGDIIPILDFSASQGHVVPTALAYHGNFYIGNLNNFPIVDGSSNIYKVNPSGGLQVRHEGVTAVLGLAFDEKSRLYVLEMTVGAENPTPGLGRVVRFEPNGTMSTIATGLSLPTGMTMGPDGNLYVSNWGFGPPIPGQGQVLKITLGD